MPIIDLPICVQDILWSALLDSPELPSYLAENRRALSEAYTYLTTWLKRHQLKYTPANAGHFVLVDFRDHVEKLAQEQGQADGGRFKHEIALLNRFVENGVCLGPGAPSLKS